MKHQNINIIENGAKITLNLGRQGEYNVRDIKFDMSDFQQKYGDGTATIVHYPANGSAYTVPSISGDSKDSAVLDSNNIFTWTVGRLATRYAGDGIAEITWLTADGLKKSIRYNTYCKEAIGDYGADRAAQQSYIDQMVELASTITDLSSEFSDAEEIAAEIVDARENAVSDIEALKNEAVSAVNTAKSESIEDIGDSKESALDALNTAKQTALTDIESAKQNAETDINAEILIAETHANNASQSATNAQQAAERAQASANNASQSATQASQFADNASQSAESASQSASNASSSADSASQSATSAQTSANNASTSEQNARQSAEDAQDILESVQAEGNTQIGRIQAKGDEIIESLPEDFTQVQSDIQNMQSDIQNMSVEISNNEIDILKAFPTDIASGDMVAFADGADNIPVKNLIVDIEPVQDFHGYGKAWIAGGGKNLLNPSLLKDQEAWNIIKIYADEGTVLTASTSTPSDKGLVAYFRQPDGAQGSGNAIVTSLLHKAVTQTVGNDGYVEIVQRRSSGTDSFQNYNWQVEVGSSATDYEPYENICPISGWTGTDLTCNNETINIDWTDEAGEVFGGTLNVTTGELTIKTIHADMSKLSWTYYSDYNVFYAILSNRFKNWQKDDIIALCSHYTNFGIDTSAHLRQQMPDKSVGFTNNAGETYIYLRENRFVTEKYPVTELKKAIAGYQVVYSRYTPKIYQLTPQEVKTILGENNIYANTGDVSVEYRADIKKYIDKVVATAISALS